MSINQKKHYTLGLNTYIVPGTIFVLIKYQTYLIFITKVVSLESIFVQK